MTIEISNLLDIEACRFYDSKRFYNKLFSARSRQFSAVCEYHFLIFLCLIAGIAAIAKSPKPYEPLERFGPYTKLQAQFLSK